MARDAARCGQPDRSADDARHTFSAQLTHINPYGGYLSTY